jgi:hypothetical protein
MSLDPLTAALDIGGKLIERIWPNPEDQAAARLKLLELQQSGDLAQIAVNAQEAKSTNWFVSGGRPFVLWVCAVGLAYAAIIEPVLRFMARVVFGYSGNFPEIDTTLTLQVLVGLLGLSGLRSHDKAKGVARE